MQIFEPYALDNIGWTKLPKPPITDEDKVKSGLIISASNSKLLRQLCYLGFEEKLKSGKIHKEKHQEYTDRCKLEIDTLEDLNFIDYVLLVWKTIDKARQLNVFIDFGRGSCASSIVFWLLKITGCDPIKHHLFFSRFVSKSRAKSKLVNGELWLQTDLIPDADLNLGDGREEIVKWLKEIYPNRISKIANISTLTGKALIKDVYKVVEEVNEEEAKHVADWIERRFGVVQDLEDVYKEHVEFRKWADEHKETYALCLNLRGLNRQFSTHASGYLISHDEIIEHSPLFLDSEKEVTCCYTMNNVQCVKLDLLGLDTNRIIKTVIELTNENIDSINLDDDPLIYNQFQNGSFHKFGLYQISANCAYRVCNNLKPKNVLELSHVNAIARPAALRYEKPYIENIATSPHPLFTDCLKWTRFQPLYQEQTMAMVIAIGFDADEAEMFRKVFAKKKLDKIDEWVEKITNKLQEKNISKEAGDVLINLAKESANYQFNLSHSLATSYLTALTTYLKYKHPLQFYLACLKEVKEKPDSIELISQIQSELRHFNIQLLPPHILHSDIDFKIIGNDIMFGLGSIKGISEKTIEKLNKFRHPHSNKFEIFLGAKEAGLSVGVLGAMILVGALDKGNRSKLVYEAQLFNLLTDNEKRLVTEIGAQFQYDLVACLKHLRTLKNEKGKPLIKDSRYATLKRDELPYKQIYEYNSKHEKLSTYIHERSLLGYSYSINLIDIYKPAAPDLVTIEEVNTSLEREKVHFVGEVVKVISKKGKDSGRKYLKAEIRDHTGSCFAMLCDTEKHWKLQEHVDNNGRQMKENDIVVVRGSKGENIIFAEKIGIQKVDILNKMSKIKNE